MKMAVEIHCQNCGTLLREGQMRGPKRMKECPDCGDPQVIVFEYSRPVPQTMRRTEDL